MAGGCCTASERSGTVMRHFFLPGPFVAPAAVVPLALGDEKSQAETPRRFSA